MNLLNIPMHNLAQIDPAQRPGHHAVATQQGQTRTWHQWLAEVQHLRKLLADHNGEYWPLYFSDSYAFSIAAFALWSTNKIPILLPDTSQHTLQGLQLQVPAGNSVGGILCEHAVARHMQRDSAPFDCVNWQPLQATDDHPLDPTVFNLNCRTALLTSGSTGDPLLVVKEHEQLIQEALLYAKLWRPMLNRCTFVATVSHQHIYGLLFKILLPMALGRPFVAEMFANPRHLLQQASVTSPLAWVASPAQLKRLNQDLLDDLPCAHVATIFSSGGLLEAGAAATVETLFPQPALEIYGSTETGGIAYRQQFQAREENLWHVLPGVEAEVTAESLLQVNSPFTQGQWLDTSDRIDSRSSTTFILRGRADRIVKLEEKRISLSAVERVLQDIKQIEQARVLVLPGKRQQLAAVLILSQQGLDDWSAQGRNALVKSIRDALRAQLEPFSLPRRYRFVHEFPTNSQSKVRMADLAALFEGGDRNTLPVVAAVTGTPKDLQLTLQIPADLDYFSGHFSNFPVVPGVVQLLWVRHFAKLHLGFDGAVTRMSKVKFKAMLRPQQTITMRLDYVAAPSRLKFTLFHNSNEISSGTMWGEHVDV